MGKPRLKVSVDVSRLSPRQHQVYALMLDGKTNREISRLLGISTNTVKIHVSGIYTKEIHKHDQGGADGILPRRDADEVREDKRPGRG